MSYTRLPQNDYPSYQAHIDANTTPVPTYYSNYSQQPISYATQVNNAYPIESNIEANLIESNISLSNAFSSYRNRTTNEIEVLKTANNDLMNTNQSLTNQLADANTENARLNAIIQSLQEKNAALENDSVLSKSELELAQNNLSHTYNTLTNTKTELGYSQNEIAFLRTAFNNKHVELTNVQAKLDSCKYTSEHAQSSAKQTIIKLEQEINTLKETLKNNGESTHLFSELSRKTSELEMYKDAHAKQLTSRDSTIANLKKRLKTAEEALKITANLNPTQTTINVNIPIMAEEIPKPSVTDVGIFKPAENPNNKKRKRKKEDNNNDRDKARLYCGF